MISIASQMTNLQCLTPLFFLLWFFLTAVPVEGSSAKIKALKIQTYDEFIDALPTAHQLKENLRRGEVKRNHAFFCKNGSVVEGNKLQGPRYNGTPVSTFFSTTPNRSIRLPSNLFTFDKPYDGLYFVSEYNLKDGLLKIRNMSSGKGFLKKVKKDGLTDRDRILKFLNRLMNSKGLATKKRSKRKQHIGDTRRKRKKKRTATQEPPEHQSLAKLQADLLRRLRQDRQGLRYGIALPVDRQTNTTSNSGPSVHGVFPSFLQQPPAVRQLSSSSIAAAAAAAAASLVVWEVPYSIARAREGMPTIPGNNIIHITETPLINNRALKDPSKDPINPVSQL